MIFLVVVSVVLLCSTYYFFHIAKESDILLTNTAPSLGVKNNAQDVIKGSTTHAFSDTIGGMGTTNSIAAMKTTNVILHYGETKMVNDLHITLLDENRGHKVMSDGRGDRSFAMLRLEIKGKDRVDVKVYNPVLGEDVLPIEYDRYYVSVQSLDWSSDIAEFVVISKKYNE